MRVSAAGDTIRLKNGQTIVADKVEEVSDKVEYTIGESTYKIPKRLVEEIIRGASLPGAPSSDSSRKSTGIKTEVEGQTVYLYESTEELREECATAEFGSRVHAEFEPRTPPKSGGGQQVCERLNVDLGPEYESLIDRGVELEKELCTFGHGYVSHDPPGDTKLLADWREFEQVGNELEGRRNEQRQAYRNADNALEQLEKRKREELEREVPGRESRQQLSELQIASFDEINRKYASLEQDLKRGASQEELRVLRMYLDVSRLPATCGHGVW
jgi:hypothetical protein